MRSALLVMLLLLATTSPLGAHDAWVLWRGDDDMLKSAEPVTWAIEDAFDSRADCMAEAVRYRDEDVALRRKGGSQVGVDTLGVGISAFYDKKAAPDHCPCLLRIRWRCMPDTIDMRQAATARR